MPDRTGQQFGNYQLIRLLGRGGFAEVYLGQHLRLATQQAAIKILHAQLSDEVGKDFQREAETIASLVHPHIVHILDFDIKDNTPFLIMDYAPNGSLRQRHPKGQQVSLPIVVSYIKQVADALQYAHNQKLIHRDIKPDNMLIGRRGEILLSDFGIAAIAHNTSSQDASTMAGTALYMAPEQIEGHPYPASDQYALGIVAYEWLCGDRPFHGSPLELYGQHLHAPPPPLQQKVATIPSDVASVVLTTLAKDPKRRFVSVQAFATALEQACQSGQSDFFVPSQPSSTSNQLLTPKIIAPPKREVSQTIAAVPLDTPGTVAPSGLSFQRASIPVVWSKPKPTQQGISRRRLVLGLGLAGLAIAGGGIVWYGASGGLLRPRALSSSPVHSTKPTPSPTLTPIPLGTLLYTYRGHSDTVWSVAWSPDGQRIVSGSGDHTAQVWNAVDGSHAFPYRGHASGVYAVAWSPDGKRIASGSGDHTVQVWNAVDGSHAFPYRGHSDAVRAVAWSPDGKRIASGSADHTAQVWNAADEGNVFTYRGHSNTVRAVAWSHDGRRIASASDDNTVQVWNAVDGGNVFTPSGYASGVYAVAWSPRDQRIASGSYDKTVQLWQAE